MEIITLEQLKTIVKDSKKQNKVIGRFGTCGGIHGGHLAGINYVREKSDIVIVTFNDWINPLIFSMTGNGNLLFNDYRGCREGDIEKLEKSNKVDYVIYVPLDDKIIRESWEVRNKLVREIDFFKENNIYKYTKQWFYLIAAITAQWYCPEHDIADIIAYGEKDSSFVLLAEIALRRQGEGIIGRKIELYPVVRDENLYPLSSTAMRKEEVEKIKKEREMFEVFKDYFLTLLKTGTYESLVEPWRFFLIEKKSLEISKRVESGKSYYFTCLMPYKLSGVGWTIFRDSFSFNG